MDTKNPREEYKKKILLQEAEIARLSTLEEALRRRIAELDGRVRELDCLYAVSNLLEDQDITLDEIILRSARHTHGALRDPDRTFIHISMEDGLEYASDNYSPGASARRFEIVVKGKPVGAIKVGYASGAAACEGKVLCEDEEKLLRAVTQRLAKIMEQEQQNLELRKLFSAVDQCSNAIMITDRDGNIDYLNPKCEEMTGYPSEEVRGKNALELVDQPDQEKRSMRETLIRDGSWRGEFLNRKKDGEPYWEKAAITAIKDEQNEITHFVKVSEDITRLKRTQEVLRQREEELLREQRRTAILKFANEVAMDLMHELRNPMVVIGGLARLITAKDLSQAKLRKYTSVIAEQTSRLEHSLNKTLAQLKETANDF